MSQHTRRSRALIALALAGALGLAACGDDDDTPAATGDTQESEDETTTTEAPEDDGETLEVTGVEYEFEGLDDEIAVGTELTFTNGGKEAHELVVMQRAEGETRSVEELMELPDEEVEKALTFKGVAIAAPGEDGEVVEGDLTLDEEGEYIAVCFIPVGTTEMPEGPPPEGEEPSGPPHAAEGMVAEFTVS